MCRRRSPVGPDWAAKERGAEAGEEEVSGEGPMGVAAGEVVEHVKRASYVVWAATKEWRRREEVRAGRKQSSDSEEHAARNAPRGVPGLASTVSR